MCGIVGYCGRKQVPQILLDSLKRLEYRGYDSAGIAVLNGSGITLVKSAGKVRNLELKADSIPHFLELTGTGIAHTRWATHGAPNEINAHPHLDGTGRFAIVHNGIIENYAELKKMLIGRGCKFVSDTDSEVIAHLVSESYQGDLLQAVAATVSHLEGTYGLVVISSAQPNLMVAARRGSPLVIGVGKGENFVASDVAPLLRHTRDVIYLEDGDIAALTDQHVEIRNVDNVPVEHEVARIDWDASAAEKGNFPHFMLKEIFEQPETIANTMRGRIDHQMNCSILSGLALSPRELAMINRVVIAGCGSSLHAGMVGEYYFEDIAGIPAEVEQAGEFRYRNPIITPDTLVIPLSQSGETADTIAAVREVKNKGALVAAICNVVGSTIARAAGRGIYIHAGPEISVASTKAFTSQVTTLLLLALLMGRNRRLDSTQGEQLISEIEAIPDLIKQVLLQSEHIAEIAKRYAGYEDFFYIGRGSLYPTALEGALKLKEISYIHAEGYHAAELKHGPIALMDEKHPVLALANDVPGKYKLFGNIQECRARKAPVIAVVTAGDTEAAGLACDVITIPPCSKNIAPLPTVVALQLFAYYVAAARGCEIDQPRNLAKSVTVE